MLDGQTNNAFAKNAEKTLKKFSQNTLDTAYPFALSLFNDVDIDKNLRPNKNPTANLLHSKK
jgi:hypothetical protein